MKPINLRSREFGAKARALLQRLERQRLATARRKKLLAKQRQLQAQRRMQEERIRNARDMLDTLREEKSSQSVNDGRMQAIRRMRGAESYVRAINTLLRFNNCELRNIESLLNALAVLARLEREKR